MLLEVGLRYLGMTLEVVLLDLLLSSDNIVMIALACRSLPAAKRRLGLLLGAGAVIVLRVTLITGARFALEMPVLKLLGGLALIIIAINLIRAADASAEVVEGQNAEGTSLWSAVTTIVIADLFMSVDNVLGMAAIARASPTILFLGIAVSVPLLMFGSVFVGSVLQKYPILVRGGGAMLGWFGGEIALSDPIFSDWVTQYAPALTTFVPMLAAIYVLAQVAIMRQAEPYAAAMRPKPREKTWLVQTVTKKPWFIGKNTSPVEHGEFPNKSESNSAMDSSPAAAEPEAEAMPSHTSALARALRGVRWPDRSEWPIYEHWCIGSLGTTGFLLFALRPLPALTTVLGVLAVLGMTLAPYVQAAMLRKGWRNAVSVGFVCGGLAVIATVLLVLVAVTGWLGPIFR